MLASATACLRKHVGYRSFTAAGVGAVAAGAILLTAPVANAIPEVTIKAECKDAGGTYNTSTSNGHRYSSCDYKDIDGGWHSDQYTDGEYQGTIDIERDAPDSGGKSTVAPPPAVIDPGLAPTTSTVAPLPPAVINPGLAPG
jgi:hypothetical protein